VTAAATADLTEAATRPSRVLRLHRPSTRLIIIFAVAFLVRAVYALTAMRHYALHSDAAHYNEIASAVAHGKGVSSVYPYVWFHHTAFRPPLYPLLLGGAYAIFGVHIGVAQGLNIILGSFVVVSVYVLTARLAGTRAALIAAGLATIYPPLVANDVTVLTEPLALLLMLGMLIAVERRSWVIGGALTGLLLLTRPSAQLLLPVVALFIWWKADWRKAAVFLVAGIICVVPWVIRNEIYFGSPVIVTSNGFNLAAIWSSQAIAQERFIDPVKDPRLASVRHYRTASGAIDYSNFNEAHLDAAFRRAGIQGLEHHLGRAPRILLDNVEFLTDYNWRWDDSAERLDGRNMGVRHATLPFVWATEILGAIGLVLLARRGQVLVPLVALYFFAVALVTVSPPRLRAPYDVLTCVAVGYLATVVWKHFEARRGLSGSKEMHSDA
jgi:4-amino-4-deoxy-L-arabinose transferase-like glycosyltransferase